MFRKSDNIFLRFDLFNNGTATPRLFVAYVNGATNTTRPFCHPHFPSLDLTSTGIFPNTAESFAAEINGLIVIPTTDQRGSTAVTFTQALTVTEVGVFAGTSGANPALLSSIDYFMDLSAPLMDNDVWRAPAPVITTWYNYSQPYGQFGRPGPRKPGPIYWQRVLQC